MRATLLTVLTLLFTTYIYGQERTTTLDLTKGNITITETGYTQNTTQGTTLEETKFTGSYVITQSDPNNLTTNMIDVKSGTRTITLNGVKATNAGTDHSILSLSKDVELTLSLAGENTLENLKSGDVATDKATLHVPPGATLTIKGEGVLYTGSQEGAAIGGNKGEHCGKIIIEDGSLFIRTLGSGSGAGIGAGAGSSAPNTGEIIIKGGKIIKSIAADGPTGAFIGGGEGCDGGKITIDGGYIDAQNSAYAAAIGGGKGGGAGEITITGGRVIASGHFASSIPTLGAGSEGTGGTISISGGLVDAHTSDEANTVPIGGTNTTVEITDNAVVFAYNAKKDDNAGISGTTDEDQWQGIVFKGKTGTVYGNEVTLRESVVIPQGFTLTVEAGKTLTVAEGVLVVNQGTIVCSDGTLTNNGIILDKGTFTGTPAGSNSVVTTLELKDIEDMFIYKKDTVYTGKAIEPVVTLKGRLESEGVYDVSYSENTDIGTGKITVITRNNKWLTGDPLELTFTINKAPLTVAPTEGQVLDEGETIGYEIYGAIDGKDVAFKDDGALSLSNGVIGQGTLALTEESAKTYDLKFLEGVKATYLGIALTPDGNNGWFKTEGGIIFNAPDGFEIALAGSELKADPAYGSSFTYTTEGVSTVRYNLRRTTTQTVYEKTKDVKYDATLPALKGGAPVIDYLKATFTLTDATSGIASYSYTLDGNSSNKVENNSVGGKAEESFTVTDKAGQHQMELTVTDVAGNTETSSISFELKGKPYIPPVVSNYYTVTLPEVEGVILNRKPGGHTVEEGYDFLFTLTLDAGYDLSVPVVTTNRGETLTPDIAGRYRIRNVEEDITVSITGVFPNDDPTANAAINGEVQVKALGSTLYIYTPKEETLSVYTLTGHLLKQQRTTGSTEHRLPAGLYLVRVDGRTYKVVIR